MTIDLSHYPEAHYDSVKTNPWTLRTSAVYIKSRSVPPIPCHILCHIFASRRFARRIPGHRSDTSASHQSARRSGCQAECQPLNHKQSDRLRMHCTCDLMVEKQSSRSTAVPLLAPRDAERQLMAKKCRSRVSSQSEAQIEPFRSVPIVIDGVTYRRSAATQRSS